MNAISQNVQHMDMFKETELLLLIIELNVEVNGGTKKKLCDDVQFWLVSWWDCSCNSTQLLHRRNLWEKKIWTCKRTMHACKVVNKTEKRSCCLWCWRLTSMLTSRCHWVVWRVWKYKYVATMMKDDHLRFYVSLWPACHLSPHHYQIWGRCQAQYKNLTIFETIVQWWQLTPSHESW